MAENDNNEYFGIKTTPSTIVCSSYGTITINDDRKITSFGKTDFGSLCLDADDSIIYPPQQVPNLPQIKMIDCGYTHCVFIDYEGHIFTCGDNENNQLGLGKAEDDLPNICVPQQIPNIPPIDFIACGSDFTVCITNERTVYSFGSNNGAQLGQGNKDIYLSPQLIPGLNDIEFITCGAAHVICKSYSNEYYAWGYNEVGQLGLGHNNHKTCKKPTKCSNWPENILDIKCGDCHTLLLTSDGKVYSFGSNITLFDCVGGQLGLNDESIKIVNTPTLIKDIPLIKQIECGENFSMCIDVDGKLWVFGNNENGHLGLGDKKDRYKPTLNESLQDIIDISSGAYHTLVKTKNNEIYGFGYNEFCQLGIETSEEFQLTPIQVLKDNEDIWASNIPRSKQKSARN